MARADVSVSVLMPVRDAGRTLRSALNSTLRSLPSDGEILVIDDRSTDGSQELARVVRDPRVRPLLSESDPGVAGALNHGLALSRGRYVARMDADDLCARGRFARQLRLLDAGATDFCFGSILNFSPRPPWILVSAPVPLTAEIVPWQLLLDNVLAHPTMACRRDALVAMGGYRATPAEDYDLWLRAAGAGYRLAKTGRFEVAYRVHAQQVSGEASWRRRILREPLLVDSMTALASRLGLPFPQAWTAERGGVDEVEAAHRDANHAWIGAHMPLLPRSRKLRMLAGDYLSRSKAPSS